MVRTTVLIDNVSNRSDLTPEWGLSLLIEFEGRRLLLDTGASSRFAGNARVLGADLSAVDMAVLSHAHYDHANGMEEFFRINDSAKMFLSPHARENCYHKDSGENGAHMRYDGITPGWLDRFSDRIVYAGGDVTEISENVFLVPHTTPGLEKIGEKVGQYVRLGDRYLPDDFSHEQSLVLQTADGLVICNSCSHGGVDNIIREVQDSFPGRNIISMIGGFHLFLFDEAEVREQARRMAATGIRQIVTGHCTGERQYFWLADELAGRGVLSSRMECGLVIEY